jgi:hypothetical protein
MNDQQQHEMVLEKSHPSGAEEWYCPICGRRFLMQWPPAYEMIVLEPGDLYARHSGSKGGLKIGTAQGTKQEQDEISEEGLRPWIEALDNLDFNW